jgi:hypothetical protein
MIIPTLVTCALLQGCSDFFGIGGGGGGSDSENEAFVATTDFETGSFATIDLQGDREVTPASAARAIGSDAAVRVFKDRVYVINRSAVESIQVLNPSDDYATELNCPTGSGSNPHDIAFVDKDKAYVTLFNETDLLIVNPSVDPDCVGFVLGRIDLSVFADADGIPEMDQMAIINDRLYVSIEHLDRDNFFMPTGLGQIAVIDVDDDTVIGAIDLGAPNPFGVTKGLTVDGDDLLVSMTGNFGELDGGLQRVDAVNQEAEPFIITEEELGGDITDFVIVSNHVGYAVISKADFTNAIVLFDPDEGTVTRTVLNADFIADIELDDRDELYVSDRSSGSEGVRVFDADDATELTTTPLVVANPPAGPTEIVFVK